MKSYDQIPASREQLHDVHEYK